MARIRSIKPEFWTSEQVVECSPTARLLFIGIWNFSDDNGIHPDSVKRLKMEIFPSDSIADHEIQAMVDELLKVGLLEHYKVENLGFLRVTGWSRHQKIDKPTYKHPLPIPPKFDDASEKARRPLPESSASPRVRNGMESNGKNMSGNPDAIQILEYLNEKAGRDYRPVKANLSLIDARLKEGATPDECRAVVDAKVMAWSSDVKMREYLRPKTLFSATNFAQYAGELGSEGSGVPAWEQV